MLAISIRKGLFILCSWAFIVTRAASAQVITGAEQIDTYLPILQGKNVGLVVNQTSQVGQVHLVDLLLARGVVIKKIFAPEHGFLGQAGAGELVKDEINSNKIEVVSLYNALRLYKKIAPAMLAGIDIIVFDLQDVGVRFYTYISTLHYVMEACAACSKPLLIFDRPNPHAHYIDGPVLEKELQSFVGLHPIPLVYGLTIGELAAMINGEGWLAGGMKCKLQVISLKNYTHQTPYELSIKPSPNLPNKQAIVLYPSLGLFEGTTISVGRGTSFPFQVLGHPDEDNNQDKEWGNFSFTPVPTDACSKPIYEGEICYGIDLREALPTAYIKLTYLLEFYKIAKKKKIPFFNLRSFDIHAGTKLLRQQIEEGLSEKEIRASWQPALEAYQSIRGKYLLYVDK